MKCEHCETEWDVDIAICPVCSELPPTPVTSMQHGRVIVAYDDYALLRRQFLTMRLGYMTELARRARPAAPQEATEEMLIASRDDLYMAYDYFRDRNFPDVAACRVIVRLHDKLLAAEKDAK